MSKVDVKPDELKALAADVGKLVAQSKEIKANLQLSYYSMQSNAQDINLSAISPLYNSLIQHMEHYGTLLHSAQEVVKRTETKFREADNKITNDNIFGWGTAFVAAGNSTFSFLGKRVKEGQTSVDSLIRFYYCKMKYGFHTGYDVGFRRGGTYTLSVNKREDYVAIAKLLQLNKNDDALLKYIKNGFSLGELGKSRSIIKNAKKSILKSQEFKDFREFQINRRDYGTPRAIGKKALSAFRSNYADGIKEVNPGKWKEMFQDLGKAGKTVKGIAVVGTAFSVANNIVDSQKNGFQGKDTVDVVTDTAVDIGTTSAAMATGAVIGSFFLPPAGTVVGAGVGMFASYAMNKKWFGHTSLVDTTKNEVKSITSKIGHIFW